MTIEDTLMDDVRAGRQVDIERALLIGSGCDTEEKVAEYKAKIAELERQFHAYAGATRNDEETAILLHEFLWHEMPKRYNGNVNLTEVIDAQMSGAEGVGNCVGLSSIYAALGIRNCLNLNVLYNSKHVMLRLKTGRQDIDIECTSCYGYGFGEEYRKRAYQFGFKEDTLFRLVAETYAHRGMAKVDAKKIWEAIDIYSRAIELTPDDKRLYVLRAEAKGLLGMDRDAIIDYDKIIELTPRDQSAYSRRGNIRRKLGDEEGAKTDFDMAYNLEMQRRFAAMGEKYEGNVINIRRESQ
ncbi:MAG: hypothetical protein V1734_06150 [Nanoarchaeota archaeon]